MSAELCDASWQSRRDGIIITTFLFALYLVLLSTSLTVLLVYINYKGGLLLTTIHNRSLIKG